MTSPPTPPRYDDRFYDETTDAGRRTASVLVPFVADLTEIGSAVDVGCGRGAWLSVLAEHGVADIAGLDGRYVDRRSLLIPPRSFVVADLTRPQPLGRRFDLAMSVEVAEHLPPSAASTFVSYLCDLADVVLFSAAVPGQGGVDHVNEQWPAYWSALFADRGYRPFDVLRAQLWNRPEVAYYYAQNLVLYATGGRADAIADRLAGRAEAAEAGSAPLPLVHPELFEAVRRRRFDSSAPPSLRAVAAAAGPAVVRAVDRRARPALRGLGQRLRREPPTGGTAGPWAVADGTRPTEPPGAVELHGVVDLPPGCDPVAATATVRRAAELGCASVVALAASGDPAGPSVEGAGARVVELPATLAADDRLDRVNQAVAEASCRLDADEVWWLYLRPGDDLIGPAGDDLPAWLAGLDHRVRAVGARSTGPSADRPAAGRPIDCPGGHDRHPLLRFDRAGSALEAGPGFATPTTSDLPIYEAPQHLVWR